MKKLGEKLALVFVKLVFAWTVLALSFEVFMLITLQTNPELNTKVSNAIMWKIDGAFRNSPDNIWYEAPKK
jgi:hypothetical protein